jgi:hypothetical protein
MNIIRSIFLILLIAAKSSFAVDINNLEPIGKATISFFGIKFYDIELSGERSQFSYNQKLLIKIIYNKNFSKEELINASIDEICRINSLERKDIETVYSERFEKLFVDVKKGDEKVAIYDPKFGLALYYNGKLNGKIKDTIFAKRFIDIWLSDKARFKDARNSLVGIK